MGVAIYVVIEKEIPGIDASSVSGKALAKSSEQLDRIARKNGLLAIQEFMSVDPEEAGAFLEDSEIALDDVKIPEEQWFDPADGLKTIRGLLDFLRDNPTALSKVPLSHLQDDLLAAEKVLSVALKHGVRFHFAVDF
jgi:hypothetical protein